MDAYILHNRSYYLEPDEATLGQKWKKSDSVPNSRTQNKVWYTITIFYVTQTTFYQKKCHHFSDIWRLSCLQLECYLWKFTGNQQAVPEAHPTLCKLPLSFVFYVAMWCVHCSKKTESLSITKEYFQLSLHVLWFCISPAFEGNSWINSS